MRILFSVIASLTLFVSCKQTNKQVEAEKEVAIAYDSFGAEIDDSNVLTMEEAEVKFKNLKEGDTLTFKFKSKISDVCQKKGCWMKAPMSNGEKVRVSFKDYGFFMPKNLPELDATAVMNGKAYISVITVDQLKHYAQDAGKSEDEIAQITDPRRTLSFEADGVLIEKGE